MLLSKSHFRQSKRFTSVLHHITLIAMLHNTFVAPAQGIIEAFVHNQKHKVHNGIFPLSSYNPFVEAPEKDSLQDKLIPGPYAVRPAKTIKGALSINSFDKEGTIGVSADKLMDNPSDNIFRVYLDNIPQGNSKVYLTYELYGVNNNAAVARSINSRMSVGGYLVKTDEHWSFQKEEIDREWLRQGENTVLFTIPPGAAHQYKVRNLKVEIVPEDKINSLLVINRENIAITKEGKIYIKGFVRGASVNIKVFAGNTALTTDNGEFEGIISLTDEDKKTKLINVRAISDKGVLGQELLFLDALDEADYLFSIEKKTVETSKLFTACTPGILSAGEAYITIKDSALTTDKKISIRELRNIDIAPMESGIINVTKGRKAYRFLPDGTKFNNPVNITIPYDSLLLPAGYSAKDIRTYYFDTHARRWTVVKKDTLDIQKHTVTSYTTHFSDYINGIVQAPESPETSAFAATMMNDIKAADPSSEMTLISPPQASQSGSANISYPVKLPSGRRGVQPKLALQYSNDGGNGWLGLGWNLSIPALSIDTKWGIPFFDPEKETELYNLGGEMLMYPEGYLPHRHQDGPNNTVTTQMQGRNGSGTKEFYPRSQGSFTKIQRFGNSPSTYYWKVTATDGTISWYGGKDQVNTNCIIRDSSNNNGNIVYWGLYMTEDVYGNNVKYTYLTKTNTTASSNLYNGKQLYISNINYTGFNSSPGKYNVDFTRITTRPDIGITARLGFKQVDFDLLDEIKVSYNNTVFRKYKLNYTTGRFSKSLLNSVSELDGAGNLFYTHTFDYYDDLASENNLEVYFSQSVDINLCADPPAGCTTDTDGDGVCDDNDDCDTLPGPISNNGCPCNSSTDTDGDGVLDCVDQCITQYGTASNNGCPETPCNQNIDTDGDGVNDCLDGCINIPGPANNNGCPQTTGCNNNLDTDGDGVNDCDDLCPQVPGLQSLFGCLPLNPCNNALDSDGDGVYNCDDLCPNVPGIAANFGCPPSAPACNNTLDDDGDGVYNCDDLCPTVPGPISNNGCPIYCNNSIDSDGDGVYDCDDLCVNVPGPVTNQGCPVPVICDNTIDTDGDGVYNCDDLCPTVFGPVGNNGCPVYCNNTLDTDNDGVNDCDDLCPTIQGLVSNQGCPDNFPCDSTIDTDGDGVNNCEDLCPNVPGLVSNSGCPQSTPCNNSIDTDGDGVYDCNDQCLTVPGPVSNNGCPITCNPALDSDGDGVNDCDDLCPQTAGPSSNSGCPETTSCNPNIDTDGDGVYDCDDLCLSVPGPASNNGCPVTSCNPAIDSDGDGVNDCDDLCVNVPGAASNNGCPIPCNPTIDTDNDGVYDCDDLCPSIPGPQSNFGCPESNPCNTSADTDGDGVNDCDDQCPSTPGESYNNGCPCQNNEDFDGDGVNDCDDDCPTEPGTVENNGCPATYCYRFYIKYPTANKRYQYTIRANNSMPYLISGCGYYPFRFDALTVNGTSSSANLYATHYGTGGFVNLCPSYSITATSASPDPVIRYSGFAAAAKTWLEGVLPGLDINSNVTVTNKCGLYLDGSQVRTASNVIITFESNQLYNTLDTDWDFYNPYNSNYMDINYDVSFVSLISGTGVSVPVLVNNTSLASANYDFTNNFNGFAADLQSAYGGTVTGYTGFPQSATMGNPDTGVSFLLQNITQPITSITVDGNTFYPQECKVDEQRLAMPQAKATAGIADKIDDPILPAAQKMASPATGNALVPSVTTNGNNFSIEFENTSTIGNPDCPSFINTDFLIQGTIPSFPSAASVLGSSKTTGYGGGAALSIGLGCKMWTKNTTFGGQFNLSADQSESFTAMIDIDGDGLEDTVLKYGNSLFYRKHTVTRSYDQDGNLQIDHNYSEYKPISGINDFYKAKSHSSSKNFQVTFGFNKLGGFAGVDNSKTKSESSVYFTDGNGDGLIDVVNNGVVYFNRLDGNGNPEFVNDSQGSPNLIIKAAPMDIVVPDEYDEGEFELPIYDVVKVWEAPYAGFININNSIQLNNLNQTVAVTIEDRYKDIYNGPMCLIYGTTLNAANATVVQNITSDTRTQCGGAWLQGPGLMVNQGEKIYFRLHANDNNNPQVSWDPEIVYTQLYSGATVTAVQDQNGLSPYSTRYSDGFILSQKGYMEPFPGTGTAQITWNNIAVDAPTDIVTFEVYKRTITSGANDDFENSAETDLLIYKYVCPAGTNSVVSPSVNQAVGAPSLSSISVTSANQVNANISNTMFYFKVSADSNVNWKQIEWKPEIHCTTTQQVTGIDMSVEGNVTTEQTLYPIPEITLYKVYNRMPAPQLVNRSYIKLNLSQLGLPNGVPLGILPSLNGIYSGSDSGQIKLIVKKNGTVLGRRTITISGSSIALDNTQAIPIGTVDAQGIEIGFYSDDSNLPLNQLSILDKAYLNGTTTTNSTPVTVAKITNYSTAALLYSVSNEKVNFYHRPSEKFGPMYRQWGQFGYSAEAVSDNPTYAGTIQTTTYGDLIQPDALVATQDPTAVQNAVDYLEGLGQNITMEEMEAFDANPANSSLYSSVPFFMFFPKREVISNTYVEKWHGNNTENYASAYAFRASGLYEALQENFDNEDTTVQGVLNTGAYAITKYSDARSKNVAAGVSVGVSPVISVGASGSKSIGAYNNDLTDYVDLNGDRYPDIVSKNDVQYTLKTGGLLPSVTNTSGLQGQAGGVLSNATNDSWGVSASGSFSFGDKTTGSNSGTGNDQKRFMMFKGPGSAGISGNFSKGESDNNRMWADVNGDGLADILERNSSGDITVRLNYGNEQYESAQVNTATWGISNTFSSDNNSYGGGIGVNMWNGSLEASYSIGTARNDVNYTLADLNGDGLSDVVTSGSNGLSVKINKGNGFAAATTWSDFNLDEESETVNSSLNFGATAALCIPIPFLGMCLKLAAFNLNGTVKSTATNRKRKSITDFDGDGFPDLLEETGSGTVKVRYSRIRRTNMLKAVHNPLGGTFTVDYDVKTPTYDNPSAKWVLKTVKIDDGYDLINDGIDVYNQTFEYEGGYYDRREREFYGYGTVKTIDYNVDQDGDPSTIYRTSISNYYNRSYFLKGAVKEQYVIRGDDQSQMFTKTVNTYTIKALNASGLIDLNSTLPLTFDTGGSEGRKAAAALLAETNTYIYELGTTPMVNKVTFEYDNRARIKAYHYLGNPTNIGDDYNSTIEYYDSATLADKNIYMVPKEIIVKDGSGTIKRYRKTADVNESTGSIGTILAKINANDWADTHMEYDGYGHLIKITFPQNEAGQSMYYKYTYDSTNHKMVTEVEDAYGYHSFSDYDYRFDKVTLGTDITGNKVYYTYDNFGRGKTIRGPKEVQTGAPYTISFSYFTTQAALTSAYSCTDNNNFMPVAITSHYDMQHPGNDIQTYTFIDGLARPVQVKKDIEINTGSPQSPQYQEMVSISGKMSYDIFGRAEFQYHPWYEAKQCALNVKRNEYASPYSSQTFYDELDRPVKVINPEGNASAMEYSIDNDFFSNPSMKSRSVTDQNGSQDIVTETYKDVNGRVTSSKNILQSSGGAQDIWTQFNYSSIGELASYTDADGITTKYEYDLMGHKTVLHHPDNGTTHYEYDLSGKLVRLKTNNLANNSGLQPADQYIKYEYHYNRPTAIKYPQVNGNDNIANVTYKYGDSGNETGRLVYQADATGEQFFEHGSMGEIVNNIRTVVGPNIPTRTFTTSFSYDSWNRLQKLIYPDGEGVVYTYDRGGNLSNITGKVNGSPYEYIKRIDYDHYEQRTYLLYGNNTETYYSFTPELRRLNNLNVKTSTQEDLFNNNYSYDKVGNVLNIKNTATPNTINFMGGNYQHKFDYDNLNRLVHADGKFTGDSSQGQNNNDYAADYGLDMIYNNTHGVVKKTQSHNKNSTAVATNTYENDYTYFSDTHQVKGIVDAATQFAEMYDYDANGNMLSKTDSDQNTRKFYWDEANRLRVVEDHDAMQHYIYDASGERILKASSHVESLYENGTIVNSSVSFDAYTTYPSGFIVVDTHGDFTKHYYAGSQRIVSRLGEESAEIFEAQQRAVTNNTDDSSSGKTEKLDEEKLRKIQVKDLTVMLEKAGKGIPVFKKYETGKDEDATTEEDGLSTNKVESTAIQSRNGGTAAAPPAGPSQFPYSKIFFYHPDHLGTSTYLTDANGMPYQFFLNLPFGESMAEQHSLTEDYETPYKFNGKELDTETGLYYYGARFYDPRTSIWLSVDPLAENYPSVNPYVYCFQNPIRLIDPNGMVGIDPPTMKDVLEIYPYINRKATIIYLKEIPRVNESGQEISVAEDKRVYHQFTVNVGDPEGPTIYVSQSISGIDSLTNHANTQYRINAGETITSKLAFDSNSDNYKKLNQKKIKYMAKILISTGQTITIQGHTNLPEATEVGTKIDGVDYAKGSVNGNVDALVNARANKIMQDLISEGVDPNKIIIGEPLYQDDNAGTSNSTILTIYKPELPKNITKKQIIKVE